MKGEWRFSNIAYLSSSNLHVSNGVLDWSVNSSSGCHQALSGCCHGQRVSAQRSMRTRWQWWPR